MDRRAFVRCLPVLPAGALTLATAGCAGVPHLTPRVRAGGLLVPRSGIPPQGAFLATPAMERPVYLRFDPLEEEWVALLARCTHRGCRPDPVGDRLVCPCHGSEYDLRGRVLEGPARRALVRFPVEVRGKELWIEFRREEA